MREDITKLEKLNEEVKFLARTRIETVSELNEYRASLKNKAEALTAERDNMRKQLKCLYYRSCKFLPLCVHVERVSALTSTVELSCKRVRNVADVLP